MKLKFKDENANETILETNTNTNSTNINDFVRTDGTKTTFYLKSMATACSKVGNMISKDIFNYNNGVLTISI